MSEKTYVYVSSWSKTSDGSGTLGLNGYEFSPESGALRFIEKAEGSVIFNVLAYDARRSVLYALEEVNDLPGMRAGGGGRIFVFAVDKNTGRLTRIDCVNACCAGPAHLTLDSTGNYLLVVSHGGKSAVTKVKKNALGVYEPVVEWDDVGVALFALNQNGTISRMADLCLHTGDGPESGKCTQARTLL